MGFTGWGIQLLIWQEEESLALSTQFQIILQAISGTALRIGPQTHWACFTAPLLLLPLLLPLLLSRRMDPQGSNEYMFSMLNSSSESTSRETQLSIRKGEAGHVVSEQDRSRENSAEQQHGTESAELRSQKTTSSVHCVSFCIKLNYSSQELNICYVYIIY